MMFLWGRGKIAALIAAVDQKNTGAVKALLVLAYLMWGGLLFIGHLVLFEYEMTASPLADTKRIFPEKSVVQLARGRQNIILFIHPMCPCTMASVDELAELMHVGQEDAIGTVIALMPTELKSEWSSQPVFSALKRIRNVSISYDSDGSQAATFGATTSGHVLIYDGRGVLQFSGGITASRGHSGDNANLQAAKNIILDRNPKFATTPVLGCALR